jgi:hypothetical protein
MVAEVEVRNVDFIMYWAVREVNGAQVRVSRVRACGLDEAQRNRLQAESRPCGSRMNFAAAPLSKSR